MAQGLSQLDEIDPSGDRQQFLLTHDGQRYRIAPFGAFGAYRLQEEALPDGSLWVARGNVLQASPRFGAHSLGELEELINDQAPELKFQAFFEAHPEFLLALGEYGGLHSQLVVHEDQGGRFVPDFFLEKLDSGFADICDLKRANERLVRVQRRRTRFRDCVAEAIAQLDYYRNWFDDRGDSAAFRDRFGFSTYRPRVVVVIGRTQSYEDDIQRAQLESGLPGWVSLKTYDDILLRAKQWRELAL